MNYNLDQPVKQDLMDKNTDDVTSKSETTTQTMDETLPWLFQPHSKPEMTDDDVTGNDGIIDDVTKIDDIMKHQDSMKSDSTVSSSDDDLGTEELLLRSLQFHQHFMSILFT
jgi:hypothetical protein